MFKRFLSKDKKIISILLFGALFIVSFVIILFGFIWINDEYSEFNSEIKKVKENYLSEQKTLIKNETEKVVYYINTVEKTTKTNLIKELTIRVNAAYAISSNIYYGNINSKSKSEIIKLVKDALQGIIFFKNTGNFSILNKKGDIILSNENPEKENKNCISLKDDV
ncbi:MAG: cache domain-containing protein, partial [Bacteroidota bacterium]|nr:cache domain-containing protein [Bacteroidota bacterium]